MARTKATKAWLLAGVLMAAVLGGVGVNCGGDSSTPPANAFKCCNADFQYFSCTQEKPECAGCTRDSSKDAMCRAN